MKNQKTPPLGYKREDPTQPTEKGDPTQTARGGAHVHHLPVPFLDYSPTYSPTESY